MKKYSYLIIIVLISSLVLSGCLLSNVGQVPATEQSGITYLTKSPSPVLVARWDFNTITAGTVADLSGNLNTGKVFGATPVDSGHTGYGNALSFNGVYDRVEVAHSYSLNITGTGITLEAWINAAEFPTSGRDITINKTDAYALQVADGGKVRVYLGPLTGYVQTDNVELSTGNWHHIAGTYDGSNVSIYVDGDLKKTVAKTGNQATSTNLLVIGKRDPGATNTDGAFKGLIDEVRIWSIVLAASQLDDMTPPTLDKSLTGTAGLDGWYTSNVEVTLTGDDPTPGSGLNRVEYSFDGTTWTTYTVPFTISTEGTTTLYHRAYDNAGNVYILPAQVIKIDKTAPTVTPGPAPTYILNQPGATVSATVTDATSGPAVSPVTVSVSTAAVGPFSVPVTGYDVAGNSTTVDCPYNVQYAPATTTSWGQPTRTILQPINTDGSSVFKQGSTVPAKFRVADVNGNSIGTPGVVTEFKLVQIIVGGTPSNINEPVFSTTPDTAFRWSASDEQWIFNISTKSLVKNNIYVYRITLNDGTAIIFQFGLK